MNTGNIGPTMVVAIPLKTNPKKSTVSKPVRLLLVRSGIATEVVVDMPANHSEAASGHRQIRHEAERAALGAKFVYPLRRVSQAAYCQ
jgi:hypothetical protein